MQKKKRGFFFPEVWGHFGAGPRGVSQTPRKKIFFLGGGPKLKKKKRGGENFGFLGPKFLGNLIFFFKKLGVPRGILVFFFPQNWGFFKGKLGSPPNWPREKKIWGPGGLGPFPTPKIKGGGVWGGG
eukprot:FR738258.1.p1 GENE.FR738258.1~~FR738258.1.p1  ORF type:complete len:127 (-),score=108.87 FR738258.1:65-445(-)